ncbi:hypothetical protein QAD02_006427 [Eretmocerus hayati]|uniref:Uncharacterized protein n=1 Tax=Eretmocerus hayati TaxID=131215 RepID=A0ACC2N0U4_9HYME|nr:hypothetical protein QAD02_006427 [Eretmocerus hayati]
MGASDYTSKPLYPAYLDSIVLSQIEMVTLALNAKPNLKCMNIYGYGPLQLATAIKDHDMRWRMVKLLIEGGVKVVEEGITYSSTCVHQPVAVNDFELVKYYLDAGAQLNCFDIYGGTPFHSAYIFIPGDDALHDMIKRSVGAGADINIAGKKGSTFLHFVCGSRSCTWELVKLLLELNAELNVLNQNNISPLAMAAKSGNLELVKNMIDAGADVNISKKCTGSPLQLGVTESNKNIVELLIEPGTDSKIEDEDGKNILT